MLYFYVCYIFIILLFFIIFYLFIYINKDFKIKWLLKLKKYSKLNKKNSQKGIKYLLTGVIPKV